jgi:two-component system, OmpR family, phosphate regulon sensor histidine kinase PhoR
MMLTKCKNHRRDILKPYLYCMNFSRYSIFLSVAAVVALLAIQAYWIVNAYQVEEKQFNEKVNIAIRSVADQMLKLHRDARTNISAVRQTSSNEFFTDIKYPINYAQLDSVVRHTFTQHQILNNFSLSLYDKSNTLVIGNLYANGVKSENATCVGRDSEVAAFTFSVRFPEKKSDILKAINLWTYSAGTFAFVLIMFGLILINLSKQKKLSEMKNDFISNMTHELQTPIANISMASEILQKNEDLSELRKARYLSIIQQENERLKTHVDQVLQTAVLQNEQLSLQKNQIDLHQILQNVIDTFQVRVQTRNGKFTIKLNANNTIVLGDQLHLVNVFHNLLDNAEKYSKYELNIIIESQNTPRGLLVSIMDHGIGISRDVQQFLFDKFYRVTSGNIHDVKGFGLGLSYVKKIIDAHHGSITVISDLHKGSSFQVLLPVLK